MTTTFDRKPKVHAHSACELFPMIGDDEFEALKADIRDNGQREPIVLVDGEVVDGRNRMRACAELGIEPKTRNLTRAEAGDVFALVMSLNFHRRHLKPHEKGAAIALWLDHHGGGKQKAGRPKKESAQSGPISVTKAAEQLGIPKATAQRHIAAAEDYKAAAPELRAKVDAGELTPKQARAKTERAANPEAPDDDKRDISGETIERFNRFADWLEKWLRENPRQRMRAKSLVGALVRITEGTNDEA